MFRRALRKFTLGAAKSAGRNSSGRITIWHRGGGAKRLQRRIDTKRSTSSMGVVERVEYDPNRSSRIALVRWVEGVQARIPNRIEELTPPSKSLEPATITVGGRFSFCSLPGMKTAAADHRSNKTSVRDLLLSALSSPKAKSTAPSLSVGGSLTLPRIAVAGAKPVFFAPEKVEEGKEKDAFALSEVRKWRQQSPIWQHRIKRKAAVSWQSVRNQHNLGLAGAIEHGELKPNVK